MVHRGLNLTLALGMFLTGIPHALCPCDHAAASRTSVVGKCPHCTNTQPISRHDPQKPCDCGACEVIQAVPPTAVVTVPPLTGSPDAVVPDAMPIGLVVGPLSEEGWAVRPPGPRSAGCDIPIFLGHLLL